MNDFQTAAIYKCPIVKINFLLNRVQLRVVLKKVPDLRNSFKFAVVTYNIFLSPKSPHTNPYFHKNQIFLVVCLIYQLISAIFVCFVESFCFGFKYIHSIV